MGISGVIAKQKLRRANRCQRGDLVNNKRIRFHCSHRMAFQGEPTPTPPMCLPRCLVHGLASLALALSVSPRALAQDIFVALSTKNSVAPVLVVPAPGNGWDHSAAAPSAGEKWNRIRRPAGVDVTDPGIRDGDGNGKGTAGRFPLAGLESVPLVDAAGAETPARLSVSIHVAKLAEDKPRKEPSVQAKSRESLPTGLMDGAWRVYLEGNSLSFTVTGLSPGRHYDLYLYGAANDSQSAENPSGEGLGARFTLAPANCRPDGAASVETSGGYHSCIYVFNPTTNGMQLAPEGTTWARIRTVVDSTGAISFTTSRNSRRGHYINGFQLVENRP